MALGAVLILSLVAGCSSDPPPGPDETTSTTLPPETTTTTEPSLDLGSVVYSYVPSVGDCFDRRRLDPEKGGDRVVLIVNCRIPHTFEVIGVVTVDPEAVATTPDPADYPGLDALTSEARLRCPPLFATWVGTPYELSELELSWVLPEPGAWEAGNRTIGCTVWDPTTERMVGTTRNAQR